MGRPRKDAGERFVRSAVSVSPEDHAFLLGVGHGSLSAGVREAVRVARGGGLEPSEPRRRIICPIQPTVTPKAAAPKPFVSLATVAKAVVPSLEDRLKRQAALKQAISEALSQEKPVDLCKRCVRMGFACCDACKK